MFDTETTTDASQRFLFGSYRVYEAAGKIIREGLIIADDLADGDRQTFEEYVRDREAEGGSWLRLLTRAEFVEYVFWKIGYEGRALIVGFNLPFDLSRLSVAWTTARSRRRRGDATNEAPLPMAQPAFSLRLFEWVDPSGRPRAHVYRPNVRIEALDSKRQFISFTGPGQVDDENWEAPKVYYRGRFLDLHTLSYVLTDRPHSLASAAAEFGLTERKGEVDLQGPITPEFIDYNRQDVHLTFELYRALMKEWDRHPIDLAPEQAFSPAAVGKAYLRKAGIRPPLQRPNAVPDEVIGYSMVAYFGGRTECRIRGVELPVRYVDFASMYPTVFVLQGLWRFVTCDHFEAEDATEKARRIVADATRERLHEQAVWPDLAGVVCRIRPNGELLPARARYGFDEGRGRGNPAWTIGLNRLTIDQDLWYTLADVLVAKILDGRTPEILEATRVRPVGLADGLQPIELRSSVRVDPATDDLFRSVIETRARVKSDRSLPLHERGRLDHFLKVFANAAAYGVFAEFRQLAGMAEIIGTGLYPFTASVAAPEEPGEFSFPPLAATITGGGRLLLALAQADVEAAGGAYVACDTDSLLIVSSRHGGLIACPGGTGRLPDGTPAVHALSWSAVNAIRASVNRLNPYDRSAIPDILKLEPENDPPRAPVPVRPQHSPASVPVRSAPSRARVPVHSPAPIPVPSVRFPSPMPVRSPAPVPVRSPTPVPEHSPAPVPVRSPAPVPVRSPAPVPERSPAPIPMHSPTPVPVRSARSPTPVPERAARSPSLSPARSSLTATIRTVGPVEPTAPVAAGDGELYALASSSKRYVLFSRGPGGVVLRKPSEHGLGLYRSPIRCRPEWSKPSPEWVEVVWQRAIAEGRREGPGPEPDWFAFPAVSRASVSTPALAKLFAESNEQRRYPDQVKPFGFLLVAHVSPLAITDGHPVTPVGPYTSDPTEYLRLPWVNRRDGRRIEVTTHARRRAGLVRLQTYADVIAEYRVHPETKSGHPSGGRGIRGSVGVLPRLDVISTEVRHIGKESNRLEEAEDGLDVLADEAYTEYRDAQAEWEHEVLPSLKAMGQAGVAELTGAPESTVRSWLVAGRLPREPARSLLLGAVSRPDSGRRSR